MNNPFTCKQCDKHHKNGHQHKTEKKQAEPELKSDREYFTYDLSDGREVYTDLDTLQKEHEIATRIEEEVQKRLTIADKPILTDCFVGYRVWHYLDGYLRSAIMKDHKWPHRKALSKDVYDNVGIHACKDFKKLIYLMNEYRPNPPARLVAGAVYMWGEVQEKTEGFLSEFAYPKEFYIDDETDPMLIMQLEEDYGVPVQIRKELNDKGIGGFISYYNTYKFSNFYPFIWNANPSFIIPTKQNTQAIVKVDKNKQST